jgi:hypothetical protein
LGRAAAFTLVFKGKGVGGRKGSFRLIWGSSRILCSELRGWGLSLGKPSSVGDLGHFTVGKWELAFWGIDLGYAWKCLPHLIRPPAMLKN